MSAFKLFAVIYIASRYVTYTRIREPIKKLIVCYHYHRPSSAVKIKSNDNYESC